MALIVKDYNTILTEMVNQAASNAGVSDFNVGSVIRTFFEAVAIAIDETYFQLVDMLNGFYINSATGSDLDKRLSDYGLQRFLAQPATLTLSFTSTLASIAVGTTVQVAASGSFPALSFTTISAGAPSASIPAVCTTPGNIGNIPDAFSTWTVTNSSGGQITAVINTSQGYNGADQESDDTFRARGIAYIQSLSKATNNAIVGACLNAVDTSGNPLGIKVANVLEQYTLSYTLSYNQTNEDLNTTPYATLSTYGQAGNIVAVVDNGQGSLGFNVVTSLVPIINGDVTQPTVYPGYRASGIQAFITRPGTNQISSISINVIISNTVLITSAYTIPAQAAITAFILQIPMGGTLYLSDLVDICMNIPGAIDVPFSTVLINGSNGNLSASTIASKLLAPVTINITTAYI